MFSSSPPPSKSSSGHVEAFSGYHEVLSSAGEKIERQKEGLERRKRKGFFWGVLFFLNQTPPRHYDWLQGRVEVWTRPEAMKCVCVACVCLF